MIVSVQSCVPASRMSFSGCCAELVVPHPADVTGGDRM
jgi:hypothetical protein